MLPKFSSVRVSIGTMHKCILKLNMNFKLNYSVLTVKVESLFLVNNDLVNNCLCMNFLIHIRSLRFNRIRLIKLLEIRSLLSHSRSMSSPFSSPFHVCLPPTHGRISLYPLMHQRSSLNRAAARVVTVYTPSHPLPATSTTICFCHSLTNCK